MSSLELIMENYHVSEQGVIIPQNTAGLEDFEFVQQTTGTILVYHHTEYKTPLRSVPTKIWLCCSEGWRLKNGKWHETIQCGWKPDRVVDTLEDVFNCYRVNYSIAIG